MATQNPHLSAEQLAALVDGGLEEIETPTVEGHLLHCRTCMAAYADTVRMRDEWVRSPDPRSADAQLRELGYGRFPGLVTAGKGDDPAAHPRVHSHACQGPAARRRAGRGRGRWLVAAVVPLAFMVGFGWLGLRGHDDALRRDPAHAVVTAAVHQASHHGMLLPGSGRAAWAPTATFRAAGRMNPDLVAALTDLTGRADDDARLLRAEGLLAGGSIDLARLLTDTARREHPGSTVWQMLAAVVAFRENDLARAETLLHGVLAAEPTNVEALFNLGLVYAAGERTEEARRIFRTVAAETDMPLASRRAAVEYERLGGQG